MWLVQFQGDPGQGVDEKRIDEEFAARAEIEGLGWILRARGAGDEEKRGQQGQGGFHGVFEHPEGAFDGLVSLSGGGEFLPDGFESDLGVLATVGAGGDEGCGKRLADTETLISSE